MDINGNRHVSKLQVRITRLVVFLLSIWLASTIDSGFDSNFVGYLITAYSVFVGLFLNLVLNVYDKFITLVPAPTGTTENEIHIIRYKNFTDKFISITTYAIFISILSIVLLSFSLAGDFLNQNINDAKIITTIEEIDFSLTLKSASIWFYRTVVFYLSLQFLWLCLLAVTSMYENMIKEIDLR